MGGKGEPGAQESAQAGSGPVPRTHLHLSHLSVAALPAWGVGGVLGS